MAAPDNAALRIGIVGAGRSRQGLGPFLARWFERHGAVVAGVSGRDTGRTGAVAVALAEQLGHDVEVFADARSLAVRVDALVVACPVAGHLPGLDAALAAGVPCLCEKPLAAADQLDAALQRVAAFRRSRLLLVENCQWPYALDAVRALRADLLQRPPRQVRMRLSPAEAGPAMVADSLSHVLSLVQAVCPLDPATRVRRLEGLPVAADAERAVVRCELVSPDHQEVVEVELLLERCPRQPRPAWFELDGVRFDRRIGADYRISFVSADGTEVEVEDPLSRLVYGFLQSLQAEPRERTRTDDVELRMRLYAAILTAG